MRFKIPEKADQAEPFLLVQGAMLLPLLIIRFSFLRTYYNINYIIHTFFLNQARMIFPPLLANRPNVEYKGELPCERGNDGCELI